MVPGYFILAFYDVQPVDFFSFMRLNSGSILNPIAKIISDLTNGTTPGITGTASSGVTKSTQGR